MDPRLPHHLEPGTFIVFDGPDDGGASVQMDKVWRAAHGLGHGPNPLLDRMPVFAYRPTEPDQERAHWEQIVAPALADGDSVFMLGIYTTHVGRAPDVTFMVNPVSTYDDDVVTLIGDDGEVGEAFFDELIQRGLYSGRRPRARR